MTQKPYLLFHQTAEQLRRVAARGGRATARNRRARLRTAAPPPPPPRSPPRPPRTAGKSSILRQKLAILRDCEARPHPYRLIQRTLLLVSPSRTPEHRSDRRAVVLLRK